MGILMFGEGAGRATISAGFVGLLSMGGKRTGEDETGDAVPGATREGVACC